MHPKAENASLEAFPPHCLSTFVHLPCWLDFQDESERTHEELLSPGNSSIIIKQIKCPVPKIY